MSDYSIYDVFVFSIKNNTLKKKKDISKINLDENRMKHYTSISGLKTINTTVSSSCGRGAGNYSISLITFQDVNQEYWIKSQEGIIFKITKAKQQELLKKFKILPPYFENKQ